MPLFVCKIMETKRPTLNDPEEFAIIKSIYFEKDNFNKEDFDPIENLERQESRSRNKNKSSR